MRPPDAHEWLAPVWQDRNKHIPHPRLSPPEVARATEDGRPALYHPDFRSDDARRRLEMMCVTGLDGDRPVTNHQLNNRQGIRCFFVAVDEDVIGYSNGEPTRYVYAEWSMNGSVHGRPIAAEELRQKGADRGLFR